MACEDFPCCGHEAGCCPDFDPDTGKQLNMRCTCGAPVPIDSRYSICEDCRNGWRDFDEEEAFEDDEDFEEDFDDEPSDFRDDVEADADTLRSCGWGTDEDYGDYGNHWDE